MLCNKKLHMLYNKTRGNWHCTCAGLAFAPLPPYWKVLIISHHAINSLLGPETCLQACTELRTPPRHVCFSHALIYS